MFGKHWTAARGTIVDRLASWSGDGMVANYDFVVDVSTPAGEVFRAKVGTPRIATDFREPAIGTSVSVEYDEDSRKVRFDKSDPQLSMKAFEKSRESAFDASLNAPAGSPPPAAPSSTSTAAAMGAAMSALGSTLTSEQLQAMLRAQAGTGGPQVVRLDSADPATAALKAALLEALGQVPGEAAPEAPEAPAP